MSTPMSTPPLPDIRLYAMEWGTGRPRSPEQERPAPTVVLADPTHLPDLLRSPLLTPGATVLVPGEDPGALADHHPGITVLTYEGALDTPGEDVGLHPDFYLRVDGYRAAARTVLLGPTLVRITDDADLDAYLADAELALKAGKFQDFLTHPAVQLADLSDLGAPDHGDGPGLRLYVAVDGSVSHAPGGPVIGDLRSTPEELAAAWRKARTVRTEISQRPQLARYLAAVGAVRAARARGVSRPRVSGFGGRLVAGLPQVEEAADAAFLLWSEDGRATVHDPRTGREIALSADAARAAEALLVTGDRDTASRYADPQPVHAVDTYFAGIGLPLTPGRTGIRADDRTKETTAR
ncbi:daptide biosynthesis RiPP recognition protein [Streptomyces sp. NPDC048442]|uniref:daptide biosynthesis RiPP recognition protein n=1 Tax=Streptomyces sp. NPDC048442 TaxID=3154823 RepID=UPI0034397406